MANRKMKTAEQGTLIDVEPEHSKEIIAAAKAYQKIKKQRCELTAKETEAREKLIGLIKSENLQRLEDGSIKFRLDGYEISLVPQDEKLKVKEDDED